MFDFRKEVDHLFDDFLALGKHSEQSPAVMPKCNISETDKSYQIEIEAPGMKEDDIELTLEHNILTVQGNKKQQHEEKKRNYHCIEFSKSSLFRSWELPANVDTNALKAQFKHGILNIDIPKIEKSPSHKRQIKITG